MVNCTKPSMQVGQLLLYLVLGYYFRVISIIGYSNTAAHIASNSMSLFVYFQSLAVTAMMAVVRTPPLAAAWAQNFMWSLGVVRVGFVQDIANWYLQATGGTPTDILKSRYLSISVQNL